ncbi:ABC transporter substrate-binding protein [Paenibacillus senegalensis]|uniref:ABC transporter substrate-binding protein n=1 Tax=Paenibacillus senegalensis TaxID=1465766 RepID=UPI000289AA44|nr:ABC transporter substrate-binding protein [Paenibacillus senegalensis]
MNRAFNLSWGLSWRGGLPLLLCILLLLSACAGNSVPGSASQGDPAASPDSGNHQPASGSSDSSNEEEKTIFKFTDSAGKEHELPVPLDNVVVINRNTAEAIQVLGAQDGVIATGDTTLTNNPYLDYQDLPDVGKTGEVNLELILSLKPQAVFAYTNRPDSTLEEKLEPAGIAVIRMNNYLPEQMEEEYRLLGKLFNKEDRAKQFILWKEDIEQQLAERVSEIPEEEKKSVMALSIGFLNSDGGYRVFPSQSLEGKPGVGEGYATLLAGGIDAADLQWDPSESSTTIMVDEEYVLSRNPDVLTLHGTWLGGYETENTDQHREVIENINNISSVPQLKAGKDNELYIFHTNFIGSDKRYIGVLQLAKYLYPERFADLDADQYLRQYFEQWLDVPYQGVWHYSAKEDG